MKKLVLLFIVVGAMATPFASKAQITDSVVTLPTVTITSVYSVNKKIQNAFHKSFPNARKQRWYKLNTDYLATFIKDDMKHQTLFKKNGYIKYDISYGMAHNLPESVGEKVMEVYKGYTITYVAEVKRYDQQFWIINLEGTKDYVVLRVEGDEFQEVKRTDKEES